MPIKTLTRRAPERGHPVAAARKRKGLTQQQLADALGVNRVSIARIEAATQSPSMTTALRLSEVLDESVDVLFGRGRGSLFEKTGAAGGVSYYGKWRDGDRQVTRKIGPKRIAGSTEGFTQAEAEKALRELMGDR